MLGMSDITIEAEPYLDQCGVEEYVEYLRVHHPELHGLLCPEKCRAAERQIANLNLQSWEFEGEDAGGRGLAYNLAQKAVNNRKIGMTTLLQCFSPAAAIPAQDFRILDVLGGDGTLARFCKSLGDHAPTVFTADISKFMIDACRAQGLPCLRQSATASMFRDNALDGVLIAYGSHHLEGQERGQAVREAFRTLKAGRRLVLHDFETNGRSAQWFDNIVRPYSRTGHPHPHFSRQEMRELFTTAGFSDVKVFEIHDPFTLQGHSPEDAKRNAIMHMYEMYDLIKIAESEGEIVTCLERLITETFGPITIQQEGSQYVAHIQRYALVAVGTKEEMHP